jgi:hypothetical protein
MMRSGEQNNGRRIDLIYASMAALNFAVGYSYIHILPVQLGADSGQNIEIANALLGRGGEFYYYRSWGYPIFLILTGFPWLQSAELVLLAQLALGSTIPYLVGSTLRRLGVSSTTCILAAAVSLVSLSPMVLAHAFLADQVSEFLLYLVAWLMAVGWVKAERDCLSVRALWLYGIAIGLTFFCLNLMRQANVVLGPVALVIAFAAGSKMSRRVTLRAISILLFATIAWVPLQSAWMSWSEVTGHRSFKQADGSLAGAMFFWNVYGSGSAFVGKSTIEKGNGPCSLSLYEALERHSNSILPQPVSADEVMAQHTFVNHYVIWKSMEAEFGPKKMDGIFWCAAFEGMRAEPKALLYYPDGLISFFLVSDVIYNDGHRQAWPSIEYYANAIPKKLGAWALYVGTGIKVVAFLIALVTFIPTYRLGGLQRVFLISFWAMLLYLAAVHIIFAAPHWRYTLVLIPGLVLLAGLGLNALSRQIPRAGGDTGISNAPRPASSPR